MTRALHVLAAGAAFRDRWTGTDEHGYRHVNAQTADRLQSLGLVLRNGPDVRLSREGKRVVRALGANVVGTPVPDELLP